MWFADKRRAFRPALRLAALVIVAASTIAVDAQPMPPDVEVPEHVDRAGTLAKARRMAQGDVAWIAAKTGWRTVSVPEIKTRTDRELSVMFFGVAEGFDGVTPLALYGREVHVLYVSDRLTFDNLIDQSILMHELVHHMQIVNAVQAGCREAEEAQAYRLQVLWLTDHGVKAPYTLLGIAPSEIESLVCH